ncbi:hypothetical protein BANRA_05117 [Escherichia coli]|uniref:hypothetical protein n=1 Tax=Escherichia coli TaxID=562 RepID=UPI000F2B07E0|nr:hypothetical protein [Escherichia coli]VCY53365.1 hypothetical protein BANRA_05117 [Escherichia coli]
MHKIQILLLILMKLLRLVWHNVSAIYVQTHTGSTLEIGNSAIDLEEKIRLCNTLKNKQYQWVITEAYELLEDYIEAIYVYTVCVRNDLWSSSDFGKVEDDEIGKREVYYRLLKAKSNPSKKITKIFRNKIPGFKEIETNNKIGKNYRFNIKLIELLRHTIVHIVDDSMIQKNL